MAKQRTVFICQQCGTESPKWMGRCPNCSEWNSLVETVVATTGRGPEAKIIEPVLLQKLSQIKSACIQRVQTNVKEFDRVLGGGIVPGSIILIAGEPGIGKSTLMLQIANKLSSVFYASGEESSQQIKLRAIRLGIKGENITLLANTDVDAIISQIRQVATVAVIDSIQTLTTADLAGMAGSVGQVKECAARLQALAKSSGLPIFLIGHVTKEGAIAGPKVLEHIVDTVIYFEGDRYGSARLCRATKNRFGATDEVGVFQMTDRGLMEVENPSELFLQTSGKSKEPGRAIVCTLEGTRPILAEIQALVVPTQLAIPRRIGQGIDYNRLQVITAILSKSLRLPLAGFDIYVNVVGGLRIDEPAADLAVALAIYSSFKNLPLPPKTVVFGELGLLGEIRQVSQAAKRMKEARRLGFSTVISSERFSSLSQVVKTLTL